MGWLELAARQNPASAERWFDLASVYRLAGQPAKSMGKRAPKRLQLRPQYEEGTALASQT